MRNIHEQYDRIEKILGSLNKPFKEALDIYEKHLKSSLNLPCKVTGIESFDWENLFVLCEGREEEYKKLKVIQPSYQDIYELNDIDININSKWMMYHYDIAALVRRISDEQLYYLGLSELKAVKVDSPNYEMLNDYSVWFVNRVCWE